MSFALDRLAYEGLLANPNITEGVIDTLLANKPNKWMLIAIAGSNKANEGQLEIVFKRSKSYEVLSNLAGNPKTPAHILEALFKDHKDEVCENTKIPRKLVSKITQAKKLSKKIQESCCFLARNPALSDKKDQLMLAKIMSNPENLFLNPNLHGEVFEYLWISGVTEWAGHFADSKNFSKKHAMMMLASDDMMIRAAVVGSKYAPKDVVLKAREHSSGREKQAAHRNTLFPINYAALDYTDFSAVLGIVERDDVPEEVLIKVAKLDFPPHSDIKFTLARANIPASVLEILFSRGEAAPSNPRLSEEMLDHYISKGDEWERRFALSNPGTSLEKIKIYLGLEEKKFDLPEEKLFYEPPDWYHQLVDAMDQFDFKEKIWIRSPLPRIFIPKLSGTVRPEDEIIGVIGGYFYKSDLGDQRIKEGYAQPIVQLDLQNLSKKTGINFGSNILQVWGDEGDWGQGCSALCEEVDRENLIERQDKCIIDVQLPEHLKDADQYRQATACFDWSDSFYVNYLGLTAPFFIKGLVDAGLNLRLVNSRQREILTKKLADLASNRKKIKDYYEKDSYQEFTNELNAIIDIQRFRLQTSIGNFNEENFAGLLDDCDDGFDFDEDIEEEAITGSGRWMPLMTLCGPLGGGIEDYYSVFYSREINGDIKYKAMAHRWSY